MQPIALSIFTLSLRDYDVKGNSYESSCSVTKWRKRMKEILVRTIDREQFARSHGMSPWFFFACWWYTEPKVR